jgi:hypothetical protein
MATRVRNGRVDADRPRRESTPPDDGVKPWEKVGGLVTKPVRDVSRESCSFAIFCDTGVGKTLTASTVLDWAGIKVHPEVGHKMMYWIDCDGGLRVTRSWDEEIRYSTVTTYEQLLNQVDDLARTKGQYFSGIVLDTGSEAADLCMDVTLKDQGKTEPDWLSWRDNSRKFSTEIIRPLRNVGRKYGIPVIFTYWLREEKTKDTGRVTSVAPDLNPALIKFAMAAVDLGMFIEVLQDEETRCAHLFATKRTKSKLRTDPRIAADKTIPPFMINPSLVPLLETMVDGKPFPEERGVIPEGMMPRFSQRFRKAAEEAPKKLTREERLARRAARNSGDQDEPADREPAVAGARDDD